MTPEELAYCRDLMNATDDILGRLKPEDFKGSAINWGDLGCALVEKVETFDGAERTEYSWRVVIEEASPAAYALASAVYNELAHNGFPDVEVQLDW